MNIDETEKETVSEEAANQEHQESTPEASSDASEAPQEAASDEAGTSGEEWLIPGRFRKNEADKLAESYRNLEVFSSRRSQELHDLQRQINAQKNTVDPTKRIEDFKEQVLKDPVDAIERIVDRKTQVLQAEAEERQFNIEYKTRMANKEFQELEPTMVQIATNLSGILTPEQKRNPVLLDWLFLTAKGMKAEERTKIAEKKGKQEGVKLGEKKSRATGEGASGSKGHAKIPFNQLSREEMKKEILKGRLSE